MHMQRRQQAGLDLSLPRRLQRLPPPQGRQSAPAEGDLKIPTGESGLSRVRLALGNRCPKHGAMWHPGLTVPPLRGLNCCISTLERRWGGSFPKGVRSGIANSWTPSRIVLSQEPVFFRVGSLLISVAEPPTIPQCGLLTLFDPTQGDLRLVGCCCPRRTPWPSGPSDTKSFSDGGASLFLNSICVFKAANRRILKIHFRWRLNLTEPDQSADAPTALVRSHGDREASCPSPQLTPRGTGSTLGGPHSLLTE